MASIRVLPPSKPFPYKRYQVLYRALDGTQSSGGIYTDDLEAEQRRLEIERRLRRGELIDADRTLFGTWVERWWPSYHAGRARLASVEKCLDKHLLPRFGEVPLGDLTATVANQWVVDMRKQGLRESTIKTYLSIFTMILNAAVDAGLLDRNPLQRRSGTGRHQTIRLKPTRQRKVWLTYVQATSLLNEAPASACGRCCWSCCAAGCATREREQEFRLSVLYWSVSGTAIGSPAGRRTGIPV